MYSPGTFSVALVMTMFSAVFWGSWANTYKGTKGYPFALFYWDYIVGVVICSLVFAFTLGSTGAAGEPFLTNLHLADASNILSALIAGFIFNIANILLVAGIDIAGLAVAFPIAIGIAVVEGVLLSYALQPKGNIVLSWRRIAAGHSRHPVRCRSIQELATCRQRDFTKRNYRERRLRAADGCLRTL